MQRITPMVDDSGAVYEVGDADRPRFDELMKGRAQQRHTYKGTDGQTYEVPEADRERFQSLVPDAEEIHRFQMDDGESVAISDSGARSLRDASFEGGISRKAWKDAGLPEKYGRSAKERVAFAQFLGESGFQGVREQEQRANFEKSIRDFTQNPVFPQIPSPEHPGPMDFEGAMKRFNEINALREKPIVPGDPNAPDLGVFEREYLNAVASSGNENAGWASITGRMLPVIGSFIRADDARVNDVYRRIMNGGFKDTFSMRKAVRTIGIPDEIIEEVERNARVGKTAMGFPVLDDKKVEEGLKSVIAPLYQAREAAKGRAAMALNESAPPSAMTEMVSGALHLPSGVAELTPLGFALSAFPNALAKAEDHISKGDSEGEALTKAFASEGVDYLVWNKLGKLVEMIPGAKNVVKGTAQKLARNSVTGSVVGQNALQLLEMNAKSGLIDLANNVVGLDKASSEEKADFGEWVEDFLSVPGNAKKMLMMLPAHLMMKGSGKIRQMSTAEGRKMAADAKAQRKLVEDYIGKEEARGLSDQDVGNLYRLVSSENFSEEAVRNFISGIEGDAGQANLRAAARTAGDVRQGLEDIESLSVPKGESEAYKAMARKADMDAQNAEHATREQEAGDAFVNNQLTREGNERIRAEKRQRKAEEAAERERAEREAREAAEEQERAIAEKAAEDNKPTIRVTGPEAESAPADRKTEYPEYAEWLRKNGRSDTDKNWNKFVAQNEMDPALKVVRDKKGKPVEPEPPAPAKAVQPQESAASTEVASLSVQRKELQAKFDANLDENGNPKDAETAHALEKELDKIDSRLGEIEAANPGTLPQDLKAVARMPKAEGKGTKAPETEGGDVPAPAEAKKPTELPTDDNGQVVGEVGDSIELENGMKATVTRRKNGGKKWTITQGKRWTTDGGKTWHDGLKPGDKFTDEDFEAPDKVPANVHFNHQKNDSGIWEVDFIRKDGSYELKPVPAEPAKNGPVSAPAEGGTITPAKPAEAPRAAEPKPGEPPKVAETATGAKDPVVDETGSAAEVVPPDSVEARISAMKRGSPEQLKAQREYLEQEIAKARAAIDGKFDEQKDYRGRHEGWTPKEDAGEIPPTITVKVPGDGEFTVRNTPDGMAFLDKVAAKFKPQKSGKAAEASAPSVPRPPTVAVAKNPKDEAAHKEMEPFVSTDRTRVSLTKPMSDGKYVYATNGKIVVRRPQRKGETVKGVDGAPVESCAGFFDNPEPDHSFKVKVAELYPKLVQADAVTGDGDGKGIIELWHDGNGTLHVRARDGEGNSYATDAGSDYVSRPLTLVNGQYLRDFLKLAAKRGAGEVEIGIVKNGIAKQADAVTLKGGDLDGVLVSITKPEEIFKARDEKDAQIETNRMLEYGEKAWVASLSKKLKEERDGLVATASQSGTTIDNELKAKIAKAKDDLAAFDAKHGKSEFVSEFVKNGGKAPAKPKKPRNKGKGAKAVQAAKALGSPDAASPLRPAPKGEKLVQDEFDGMGGVTESVSEATRQAFAANPRTKSWEILAEPKTVSDVKPADIAIETPLVAVGDDGASVKPQSNNAVRNSVKDVFRSFGVCENAADKNKVVFPGNSAGKMMSQSGADVAALAPHMKQLFESAVPAWYEPETTMDGHTPHPDVAGYRHYLNKFRTTDGSEFFIRFTVREGKGKGGFKGVHAATVSDVKIYESKNAEPTILVDETSRRLRAFTDNKLSDFLSTVNAEKTEKPPKTLDGQTIDPTGEKTDKNPLGKALVPKDGSIEQEIDAEIAADEALAAKGGGKPQGVPPAPAPGSAGNPNLDPSYEPEAFGAGIEGNPIARQQVIDKFRELFGDKVAIRGKNTRTLGPTVAGHFEPDAHIIRSKDPISLRTIPHEIGHFIDALLRRRGLARPPAVRHDLIALGKLLYGKKQPNGGYESEGFAELLKYYMQGNDAGLRKDAPAAYDWFMNRFAPANPDTMARIDAMRDMIDRFQNQSAVQAVRGISAPDKTFGQRVVERIADIVNALKPTQENWIDKGAFITKAMKASGINRLYDWRDALKRGDVAEATRIIENHPVLKWKLYNGKAGMRAFVALKDGLTDLSGTRRYTYGDLGVATPGHAPDEPLPTFREIFGDFTKRELDDFKHEYAIARIAKELYLDRGLEFGLTANEVEPVLRKYANNTKFRDALDRYTHYKHGVLHLLVDAGAMSQQQFEAIVDANPIYAKIARRRESTDFFRNAMLRRGGKAVNKRKGGAQMIEDIFDAGLVDDERIFRAAFQADLFRSLVRAGELAEANNAAPGGVLQGTFSVGANWIKEVPNAKAAVTFTPEKLRKQVVDALNAAGAEAPSNVAGQPPLRGDTLFDALFGTGDNLTIFKERPSDGKNGIVSIYGEDGKLRTFELPENNAEGWAKGLLDFTDGKNASIFEKWAEISVASVRTGATMLNPEFALRNLMRDTFHAATLNQHGTFLPVVGSLEGLYHDLMGTAPKQMFEAMGLEMGGMLGRSRLASARKSNQYLMSSNWIEAQMRKGLTKAVADLVGVTENATRIKQFKLAYENMLRQGVSDKAAKMIAGCNALDTTIDFLRSGYTGQKINRIVPFFNAGVQGLDQFARALGMLEPKAWDVKDSRFYRLGRTLLQGLAYLSTAALFSELYNRSDPERKRKAEELPPHERWNYISFGDLRIPVPYEAGYLFASIPRAVAAAAIDGDDRAVPDCLKMFANTFPLQVDSLHGFMRNAAFVGPLVDVAFNEDWKYKTIVQQYVKDGKESWEWYGPRTTGLSKDLGKALHKVIGDSYFSAPAYLDTIFDGYTGGMYSKLAHLAYGEADFSFDPSRQSDWPVVGTFFRRPESSRIPNDFYDERAKLERKAGSGTATIAEYGRLSAMDLIAKDIRPYWNANRALMADRDMPRKERLDRMDENTRKATDAIRAMSNDESELRSRGMKALAAKLANPSATEDSWERAAKMLKADGATLQDALIALHIYGRAHGWTRGTVSKHQRILYARWK